MRLARVARGELLRIKFHLARAAVLYAAMAAGCQDVCFRTRAEEQNCHLKNDDTGLKQSPCFNFH